MLTSTIYKFNVFTTRKKGWYSFVSLSSICIPIFNPYRVSENKKKLWRWFLCHDYSEIVNKFFSFRYRISKSCPLNKTTTQWYFAGTYFKVLNIWLGYYTYINKIYIFSFSWIFVKNCWGCGLLDMNRIIIYLFLLLPCHTI